ncbi:hypothetical protein DdX_08097 [Ditylenchus destructor]|uniref:Uncharacterized protein n=1 Tax=Ditylenchus destructor TaxID=166010 RepID=A0AAD4N4M6_9BILA|nr:hypothetical protein DdX_08097 [Ditylenchus destructor]
MINTYLIDDVNLSPEEHARFGRAAAASAVAAGIYIGSLPIQKAIPIIVVSVVVGIIFGIIKVKMGKS